MSGIWELEKFKDRIALVDEFGNEMTYAQMRAEARVLAEKVGKRCLVFSLCRNEIGSVLGYVGFVNHDIVPVMHGIYL